MKETMLSKLFIFLFVAVLAVPLFFVKFDYHSLLFVAAIFLCSISAFSVLKNMNRFSVVRAIFLIFPVLLFFIIYLMPISLHSRSVTADDIMAVLQTNVPETFDYLKDDLRVFFFLLWFVALLLFVYLAIKQNAGKNSIISGQKWAIAFLIAGGILLYFNRDNTLTAPLYEAAPKIKEYYSFYDNLKNKKPLDSVQKNTLKGIYVVVIGESQNRHRMSVYGYKTHLTTPYLSKVKHNKNWIFFDNAYSCHTHTVPTLTYALTQKNINNKIQLKDAYNLLEVLHEFNTYWISNQKAIGYYGDQITEMGLKAHTSVFTNKSFIKKDPYDEVILKELPKEKKLKDNSVVFIHLMGNHGSYKSRYPKKYGKWRDTYDNSVLYNDHIVQKIFEHFSSMKDFMGFIYFSDHADDVRCKCHDSSRFTWEMTKIPFYAYFSDKYIHKNPQKWRALKAHLHTPFTNDMFFDTFLGILGVNDKRFYVPTDDLSSKKYRHSVKDLSTLHGKQRISAENKADKLNKKIYLHRVNSPEKLKELGHKYVGLEMDIIYYPKEDAFENSHNAESLQKYSLNKTLKMYYHMFNRQAIWFDFKNLSDENKVKAEQKLSKLIKKYHVNKNNVWVESHNYNALEYFTQKGWRTSYYVPYYNFEEMSAEQIADAKKLTEDVSFSGKVLAISFAGEYYPFIKSLKLNEQISLLTWFSHYKLEDFKKLEEYPIMMNDKQLKVILIKDTGKHHR
ncbi:MAG: sulfatase-like hydrolase/transferase [Alphaproteobacteria bacterium]|nr:sulfatase-like hydrolase/transferase [Alphaproteobacteria bacterium]